MSDLDALADRFVAEQQLADEAGSDQLEHQLQMGHVLLAARSACPSDNAFGEWLRGRDNFGRSTRWLWTLRQAAEHEDAVRETVGTQVPTGAPNLKSAVRQVRAMAELSEDERTLLKRLDAGETVVVNMGGDGHGRLWAMLDDDRKARVDRKSDWGNPFTIPDDGDRDAVCDAFAQHYWPHKPGLHQRADELVGKALGCWCAPQRCHADHLKAQADATR